MQSLFLSSLGIWQPFGYLLVFLGMLVEGDAVLFIAIFLTHQGYFSFWPATITIVSGALLGDILWFELGRRLKNSQNFLRKLFDRLARPFEKYILGHPIKMIFASKYLYGFHRAILVRYGMITDSLWEFLWRDSLASLLWMITVSAAAVGASTYAISHKLRFVEKALFFGVLGFFILEHVVSLGLKRVLGEKE